VSFILLTELYEEPSSFAPTVRTSTDIEGNKKTGLGLNKFSLRNIVLNKNNVVLLREDRVTQTLHENDELKLGLRKDQAFTRVYLSCSERVTSFVTVIGNLSLIATAMENDGKNK
tara:strand:+ start:136 stop:480 length:345 start_codon:yes stop_codon:yes gene_type:complete